MTSVVDIILRCPECGGLNRDSVIASSMPCLMLAWNDGDSVPPCRTLPFLRCALCGRLNARSSFEPLGAINHGRHEFFLRLGGPGPEPVKVMKRLRGAFGWDVGEIKSRLASLPVDLPKMVSLEDSQKLHAGLTEDGARCEIMKIVIEAADPPERLDAPWAISAESPSKLEGAIHQFMPGEKQESE